MRNHDELESRKAELAAAIARIDDDPDYQTLVRGEKKRKEREDYQRKLALVNYDLQLCDSADKQKRLAAADPRIDAAIRWARDERTRTAHELSNRGIVEKSIFGAVKGYLNTNEPKITKRLTALDDARRKFEALKLSPVEDIAAEIRRIQAEVPPLDTATEKVECSVGIAAALRE